MKSKKNYWAKDFFNQGLKSFYSGKWYFIATALLFLLAGLYAFYSPEKFTFLNSFLKSIVSRIDGLGPFGIAWFIFSNNVTAAFTSMISGVLFGVIPLFNILTNGAILGYVISLSHEASRSSYEILFNIVPHGIFELPAIFISVGLGIRMGFGLITNYFSFHKKNRMMKSLGFLLIVFAILAYITVFSVIYTRTGFDFLDNGGLQSLVGRAILMTGFSVLIPCLFLFVFSSRRLFISQRSVFAERFIGAIKTFFTIVLPLLIVAAIIETLLIVSF